MSKNKSSTKKTAQEKNREFSAAVKKKSQEFERTEEKSRKFSETVEKKTKELAGAEEKRRQFAKTVEKKNSELNNTSEEKQLIKASLSRAAFVRYAFVAALVGAVSIAGVIMCVLNIVRAKWFFAADYMIAALLGISIVIVKINTLRPTYAASDGNKLILRAYDNKLVPYSILHKAVFLCDFIPAKTETTEVNISEIKSIIIGTKNYIKRHCGGNESFIDEIEKIEKSGIGKNTLLSMDIMCLLYGENKCAFMSVEKFEQEDIASVVRSCMKINPDAEVLCNNKYLRNKILFDLPSK